MGAWDRARPVWAAATLGSCRMRLSQLPLLPRLAGSCAAVRYNDLVHAAACSRTSAGAQAVAAAARATRRQSQWRTGERPAAGLLCPGARHVLHCRTCVPPHDIQDVVVLLAGALEGLQRYGSGTAAATQRRISCSVQLEPGGRAGAHRPLAQLAERAAVLPQSTTAQGEAQRPLSVVPTAGFRGPCLFAQRHVPEEVLHADERAAVGGGGPRPRSIHHACGGGWRHAEGVAASAAPTWHASGPYSAAACWTLHGFAPHPCSDVPASPFRRPHHSRSGAHPLSAGGIPNTPLP